MDWKYKLDGFCSHAVVVERGLCGEVGDVIVDYVV